MTKIRMTYIGRNGREYPCRFSPGAVRQHWMKCHGVHLEYETASGTVHIETYMYPLSFVGVFVPSRMGIYQPVKHRLNGLRIRSSEGYPDYSAWWC